MPSRSGTGKLQAVSASAPSGEDVKEIVRSIERADCSSWQSLDASLNNSGCLPQLRFLLKDKDRTDDPRDSFRRANGFQAIISLLRNFQTPWQDLRGDVENIKQGIQFLAQLLAILVAAIEHHAGNSRYLRLKTDGWPVIQMALQKILALITAEEDREPLTQRFFGHIFATSVGAEVVSNIYLKIQKLNITSTDQLDEAIQKELADDYELVLPELLQILVCLWSQHLPLLDLKVNGLRFALPLSIKIILNTSRHNIIAANSARLFEALRPLLFDGPHSTDEKLVYQDIASLLCEEGLNSLDDAHYLFSKSIANASASSFLLRALQMSQEPPSIQFDLSLYGSSSVELGSLKKPFPSPETSGYTLALWARFDDFDPAAHTTLFGAFDKTQTCFVLAYLEKDTQHLILQTATKGSRPSVRFKSVVFEAGRWYHICIVHRRPKTITTSKAHLFVNGEFVEQVKATFPAAAPSDKSAGTAKVQAFLGTPQDLTPGTSNDTSSSQWSLASAMLFQNVLSDDLVAVMYHLGPKYHGNLQDCLGSFQTYEASAALNLRNESLNPGKEEASDLIKAIRHKGGDLINEGAILFNVSPAAVLDNDDRNNIDESQLVKSLSKNAAKNLYAYTRNGTNAVVVNGAVPAINEALVQSNGIAVLLGDPMVTVPQSLEEISWRLGGCAPVGLCLVHRARTTEEVALAVDILLQVVQCSWRNSEIMERHSGYSILSNLIRDKLEGGRSTAAIPTPVLDRQALGLKLLKSILSFLGYDEEDESQCIINNPLAYKVMLIDSGIWRCHSTDTQQLYFRQITSFAVTSLHAKFNLKRLNRMRATKRLLEALKSEPVSRNTMSFYAAAFKALLPPTLSAETLRSFALFITYSVHKRHNSSRPRRSLNREARSRSSSDPNTSFPTTASGNTILTQFEIGVEVLRLYSHLLCTKGDTSMIRRFAKAVTNKWLLYLLSESSPDVVVLSVRILVRLLVVHGDSYVKKFKEKTGGFAIMSHRLKRWWHLPALWPTCFAILFGIDIVDLNLDRAFDLFGFVELFDTHRDLQVRYPDMLEVIMKMLQSGLKTIVSAKEHQSLAPTREIQSHRGNEGSQAPQRLSMSTMAPPNPFMTLVTPQNTDTFSTVVSFLADLHTRSAKFRDFAANSNYVDELLYVLFPVVVGSDIVDASTELDARDSMLSFEGADIVVNPLTKSMPLMKALEKKEQPPAKRGRMLRRGSSYVVVTREQARQSDVALNESSQVPHATDDILSMPEANKNHTIVQSLLEMVIAVFLDQLLERKDFPGLGLFLKTPPGFVEHQHYFESWILRNTVSQLSNAIALDQKLLLEPRVITNLARFFIHLGDSLFEGWFIDGANPVLDLSGSILEYLQRRDVAQSKSVRLCTQAISTIRSIVFRIVLLNLSHVDDSESKDFLEKLAYWQNVLLSATDTSSNLLPHICYLLYASLISPNQLVRTAAADLWRIILVQKPTQAAAILGQAENQEQKKLVSRFEKLVELDNETFIQWIDEHRKELDALFFDTLSKSWDSFVADENRKTTDCAKARFQRRRERLKTLSTAEAEQEELIRRHEMTFDYWTSNIYTSENLKHHRLMQDQQDDRMFTETIFFRMQRELARSTGLGKDDKPARWRLDQTEGRNRIRMRLIEEFTKEPGVAPKRKGSDIPSLRIETRTSRSSSTEPNTLASAVDTSLPNSPRQAESVSEPFPEVRDEADETDTNDIEESFEIVEDPNEEHDEFEDKNRKVMRSLHRGDQVKNVANISRIVGLEAVEGLLILGKDYVYLIDNFFQRSDGEIVNVWQAPQEERDPYVRMISGRDVAARKPLMRADEHEARSWKWSEVISVSKRRFLFRDVAIEMFFGDGRSYLLTIQTTPARNNIHSLIVSKAPQYGSPDSPQSESAWRYETLKSAEEEPQTLGSRFANIFSNSTTLTATRKWQKGEMSNFHYLMLINTMAGRTYNDLTQYPVFPWVIADYTSSELDLTDPRSFRDLSKPMGCQTAEREAEFRERYKSFAEMDATTPAFHYGTHYSSAMIVCSYLVRLQPFTKSYLLLQGGSFDHPDRMFFSIQEAWKSASKSNMTDVRELTPEFFYLPEFLQNTNDYDFGLRQNKSSIGSVQLPPWAKGDPRIFIAKQREALESPHVSKNLHKWIDLIFGCKQKGEAAIEAVNVYHYLSYQGAKDLDTIDDPMERLATIGIIHNFGQTPYQIFPRTHPPREHTQHKHKRLDTAAESLTRLPANLLDSGEKVASLTFAWKIDRLLCSGAFRLNIPPSCDKYMEWGFFDGSIRFYAADSRKQLGLFEHLHIGQLSCALFADSKTLITTGTDCTIGVWTLISTSKHIDLQPKATLFGHHHPVTSLSLSRSFNALLSASSSGELMLWDLNRCEFARKIIPSVTLSQQSQQIECTAINDVTGNIVVCHGPLITMYSLNGDFLLSQDTSDHHFRTSVVSYSSSSPSDDDIILSVACYEGAGNEWLERELIFTGHRYGVVKIWSKIVNARVAEEGEASFELELIRQLNHVDSTRDDGANVSSGITCILAMPQVVYTGDEDGRVYEWNCVQRT